MVRRVIEVLNDILMNTDNKVISVLAIMIVIITIVIRSLAFPNGDPWGDEAWYYYISKTLYWNWDPHLSFLPPIRWAFMLMMHLFAKALFSFRIAHTMLTASLLLIFLYIAIRERYVVLLIPALLYVLNSTIVFFSNHVITSTLAGVFAVLSVLSYLYFFNNNEMMKYVFTTMFSLMAIGCWEAMSFFTFAMALMMAFRKERVHFILSMLLITLLGISIAYDNVLLGYPAPGWSRSPLKWSNVYDITDAYSSLLLILLTTSLSEAIVAFSMTFGMLFLAVYRELALMNWYYVPSYMLYYVFMMLWTIKILNGDKPIIFKIINIKNDYVVRKIIVLVPILYLLIALPKNVYGIDIQVLFKACCNDACFLTLKNILEAHGIRGNILMYKPFWAYPYFLSLLNSSVPPKGTVFNSVPPGVIVCEKEICLRKFVPSANAIIIKVKDLRYYGGYGEGAQLLQCGNRVLIMFEEHRKSVEEYVRALAHYVYDIYKKFVRLKVNETVRYDASILPSDLGLSNKITYRYANPSMGAGYIIKGPYVYLPKGTYLIKVALNSTSSMKLKVKINSDIIAERNIRHDTEITIDVKKRSMLNVELYYPGRGEGKVYYIEIKRLG